MFNKYDIIYNEMLSKNPSDMKGLSAEETDVENLRLAVVGELDAINLYNQMANTTKNNKVREVLLDIAGEEKVHVGELQKLLDELDPNNKEKRVQGREEVINK
jgi:rubrerythrin